MSRGSAGHDLASSNVERQSELVDETGRAGRGASSADRAGAWDADASGASTLDREEPRTVSREDFEQGIMPLESESDEPIRGDGSARGNGSSSPSRNGGRGGKSYRGFAAMDTGKQKEIASKGGRAAHEKGTAHQWTSDEARAAGRKGGERVSQNRQHMSIIGRRGGEARGQRARRTPQES